MILIFLLMLVLAAGFIFLAAIVRTITSGRRHDRACERALTVNQKHRQWLLDHPGTHWDESMAAFDRFRKEEFNGK